MPFKIPVTAVISFAARHCAIGRSTGIPPPTEASKRKFTLCSSASLISSAPFAATSSLFDVTTLLSAQIHFFAKSYAGFIPPITSTTTFTSPSLRIVLKSFINLSLYERPGKSRKSRIYLTFTGVLVFEAMRSA